MIRDSKKGKEEKKGSQMERHLDERILETPSFAIENATQEVINMGKAALENFDIATAALLEGSRAEAEQVEKLEAKINQYEKILTSYLVKINNQSLNEEQHLLVKNLFYTVSNFERVSDHCENLSELAVEKADKNIVFSVEAAGEMKEMIKTVRSASTPGAAPECLRYGPWCRARRAWTCWRKN